MARLLTPTDAYAMINEIARQATGQKNLTAYDTSSFVSVGEKVLATGTENVLNALSIVLGRTLMAVRPYNAKFKVIDSENADLYGTRVRKISFLSKDAVQSGDWNTNAKTNFAEGYDNGTNSGNSTASQWEQHRPVPVELNFSGQDVWEYCITIYQNQLKSAFTNESDFIKFMSGIMTEVGNDIEVEKESFNRMTLLNAMAGVYDLNGNGPVAVDLTSEFNTKFGTSYTRQDLLTTYRTDFMKFFVSVFKTYSDYLTDRTALYHWNPSKQINGVTYNLLRHTPKDRQKAVIINEFINENDTFVLSEIFNKDYLEIGNTERVNFWQNPTNRTAIKVTPAIPDVDGDNNGEQKAGTAVALDYVVGMLFDVDAIMTSYQFEDVNSTELEARKRFRNQWYTFSKNAIVDYSENMVLFYLG